ncbi:MAG: response regulator [Deltaproteobacteria bacterium]|nr:response regulator [Deltaproteobacteria bacterium]
MAQKKVLIIDDDAKLRRLLEEYLGSYDFQVLTLEDGTDALNTIKAQSPDMVILDIMMPKMDGLEVLKVIRAGHKVPVIMLTARGEDADRIVGLELGADDYLPKPFNPRELLARMKAVWRRSLHGGESGSEADEDHLVRAGGLVLNKATRNVSADEREIELSTTEYKLLEALMENSNRVLNRDQLMNLARGRDFMAFDRSIDVHISKLRAKVESNPGSPKRIKTVWGTGYMFVDGK